MKQGLSVTASSGHRITSLKDISAAYHQRDVLGWTSESNRTPALNEFIIAFSAWFWLNWKRITLTRCGNEVCVFYILFTSSICILLTLLAILTG